MDRIRSLIRRHLHGEITAEEQIELRQWLDESEDNRALFDRVNDTEWMGKVLARMDRVREDRAWERLRVLGTQHTVTGVRQVKRLPAGRRIARWAVAAAVIGLLISGGWWYLIHQRPRSGSAPVIAKLNDVQPGGNKAILTLASGQRIILDSVAGGRLSLQGSTEVVKAGQGQLVYQSMGKGGGKTVLYNTLSVPRGGQYQLTLQDGTKVWLNAASSITYPTAFSGAERKVTITGEAYFEVTRNVSKPFIVQAGEMNIRVLGTSFNINAYADEISVNTTLTEGKVEVKAREKSVILLPGQQAQVFNGGEDVRQVTGADVQQVLAWKNGLFSFRDADLPSVMRQLGRWYDIEVVYDGRIPNLQFNGKIGRTLTLGQVLDVLAKSSVHYTIEPGNKLIIRP